MARIKSFLTLPNLLLIGIIILTLFTHLFRIDHTYIFHNDEARDALIVKKMWDSRVPIFLGPQTSIGNMYLGPLYYYFMTPALILSNFDPVGPAAMVAIFAVATTILLFFYGKAQYGLLAGTVASLFYTLSPVMLHYSRSSWNPNLVPFFSLLLLISATARSRGSYLALGLLAGVIFQLHYVALTLVLLVGLYKLIRQRDLLGLTLAIIGFFLSSSPFWLFELRHQWVNSSAFINFLTNPPLPANTPLPYLLRLLANATLVLRGIVGSATLSVSPFPTIITIVGTVLFIASLWVKQTRLLLYYLLGTILVVSVLKEPLNVHYLAHLFPVICLYLGALVANRNLPLRATAITYCLYLLIFFIPTLRYNLLEINSIQPVRAQALADYIVQEAGGAPYNLIGTTGTYTTPIAYYLALSNNPPRDSRTSLIFNLCESGPCPTSDLTNPNLFADGPTHPAITEYLGHPQLLDFHVGLTELKNVPVSYGTYVATYEVKP